MERLGRRALVENRRYLFLAQARKQRYRLVEIEFLAGFKYLACLDAQSMVFFDPPGRRSFQGLFYGCRFRKADRAFVESYLSWKRRESTLFHQWFKFIRKQVKRPVERQEVAVFYLTVTAEQPPSE